MGDSVLAKMEHQQRRAPSGDRLPEAVRQQLSQALDSRDPRELGVLFGVSAETVARAAAGCRVMRASKAVILAGLQRLQAGDNENE